MPSDSILSKRLTAVGEFALEYMDDPAEKPASAPFPELDAQAFAEWQAKRLPRIVKMKLVTNAE